ncbi:3365_t:CDS:2, partial [Funneliformis caledonium]
VDEYDTLDNNCMFKHEFHILNDAECNDVDIIEQFFNTNFFAVIKRECCGLIDKLYVIRVVSAFHIELSLLLILDDISERSQFYRICGFTEEVVQLIAKCYFDNNMQIVNDAMDQIRQLPMMLLRTVNKAIMQVTFEIFLPISFHVAELHLIIDGMKKSDDRRFGFVDLFVFESGNGLLISNIVLKLKYITITGLLNGTQRF